MGKRKLCFALDGVIVGLLAGGKCNTDTSATVLL